MTQSFWVLYVIINVCVFFVSKNTLIGGNEKILHIDDYEEKKGNQHCVGNTERSFGWNWSHLLMIKLSHYCY